MTPSKRPNVLALVPATIPGPAPGPAAAAAWLRDMFDALPALVGQELARLLEEAKPPPDPRDFITVNEMFKTYFETKPDQLKPAVMADRQYTANLFAKIYGDAKVGSITALNIQHFIQSRESWNPGFTRKRVIGHLRRIWNWSIQMSQVRNDNYPFKGLKPGACSRRQPLPDCDYQTLLRENPPALRRFLVFLKFSGCRPCEASTMCWRDIDLSSPVPAVRLTHHKTDRTGRPRIIILHSVLVKLINWLLRHPRPEPHAWLLNLLMANGPTETGRIARLAKEINLPPPQVWRVAKDLGVQKTYIGQRGKIPRHNYYLPWWPDVPDWLTEKLKGCAASQPDQFVFLNSLGNPWNQSALTRMVQRMRRRGCKIAGLYGLRHRFGTEAVKQGLNLKVISSLMGHENIRTTEGYLHAIGDNLALLSQELQKIPFSSPKPRTQP
jgi:integrase